MRGRERMTIINEHLKSSTRRGRRTIMNEALDLIRMRGRRERDNLR